MAARNPLAAANRFVLSRQRTRQRLRLSLRARADQFARLIAWPSDGAEAHPSNHPQLGAAQPSRGTQGSGSPPQRTRSNYRADWIWEKHNLGRDDRLDQPQ